MILLLYIIIAFLYHCNSVVLFENISLTINPSENNYNSYLYLFEPVQFNIIFRTLRPILPYEVIVITLPRFTRKLADNTSSYESFDLSMGNLKLSPSTIFEGQWVNGQLNASDKNSSLPYTNSELYLRSRFGYLGNSIANDTLFNITVYLSNGIGIYCGFPNSTYYYSNLYRVTFEPFVIYNSNITNSTHVINNFDGYGIGCEKLGNCNNHGICDFCYNKCICEKGFGSPDDIITYGNDIDGSCSTRVCPVGKTIVGTSITSHTTYTECSNVGNCDRSTGICKCYPPYQGVACERIGCPNNCSGHGQCLSMRDLAKFYSLDDHYPFQYGTASSITSKAWDYDVVYGCACDSSWKVGYGANETQLPEYFGADCSQKHCPSGDNPFTPKDEENCKGVSQTGAPGGFTGLLHNRCQIDCSNRGICDYTTGKCQCFEDSYGDNCGLRPNKGTKIIYKTVNIYD